MLATETRDTGTWQRIKARVIGASYSAAADEDQEEIAAAALRFVIPGLWPTVFVALAIQGFGPQTYRTGLVVAVLLLFPLIWSTLLFVTGRNVRAVGVLAWGFAVPLSVGVLLNGGARSLSWFALNALMTLLVGFSRPRLLWGFWLYLLVLTLVAEGLIRGGYVEANLTPGVIRLVLGPIIGAAMIAILLATNRLLRLKMHAAREAKTALKRLFDVSEDMMIVIDPVRGIVDHNESARSLVQDEAGLTRDVYDLTLSEEDGHPFQVVPWLLKSGSERKMLRWENGTTSRTFLASSRQLPGSPTQFLLIARDLTEERAQQQRLERAEKMRAIGQLASGIAHEINNKLATVRAGTAVAKNGASSEVHSVSALDMIATATEEIADLVGALTEFARGGSLQAAPLSIEPVLKEASLLLAGVMPSIVDFRASIDVAGRLVRAEADGIVTMLLHLGNNAQQAMPHGGVLQLRACLVAVRDLPDGVEIEPGGHPECVLIEVVDSGQGMSAESLERAFEPFFTTRDVGEGTGLGLSACLNLAERYGGTILLESEVGRGTRAKVYLPICGVAEPAPSRQPSPVRSLEPVINPSTEIHVDD